MFEGINIFYNYCNLCFLNMYGISLVYCRLMVNTTFIMGPPNHQFVCSYLHMFVDDVAMILLMTSSRMTCSSSMNQVKRLMNSILWDVGPACKYSISQNDEFLSNFRNCTVLYFDGLLYRLSPNKKGVPYLPKNAVTHKPLI